MANIDVNAPAVYAANASALTKEIASAYTDPKASFIERQIAASTVSRLAALRKKRLASGKAPGWVLQLSEPQQQVWLNGGTVVRSDAEIARWKMMKSALTPKKKTGGKGKATKTTGGRLSKAQFAMMMKKRGTYRSSKK